MSEYQPVLDRLVPTDFSHVDKYPLQAMPTAVEELPPLPVIMGTNWYRWMSNPVYDTSDGRWWIGRNVQADQWGPVLGGHAYTFKPSAIRDLMGWWEWFDQGEEGKCCSFAGARAMTLIDRVRVDPHGLYFAAQRCDEWPGDAEGETGPQYEGTSVRATIDVLRNDGAAPVYRGKVGEVTPEHGVKANRWAVAPEEIFSVLKSPWLEKQGVFQLLNSWGPFFPHIVYVEAEKYVRLLREDGEATMFTPN
jgi:hypothetical protein